MIDWGISAVIIATISFGYSVWLESKIKKLNDRIAHYESKINNLPSAPIEEKPLAVHRVGVPNGGVFDGISDD